MSFDSKNCRSVKRYLINRTLLIEHCWLKSNDKVTYRKVIKRRNVDNK